MSVDTSQLGNGIGRAGRRTQNLRALWVPVLLVHTLNLGAFSMARDCVQATMDALAGAPCFSGRHEALAFDYGFHVFYVGEEARAVPRLGHPEPLLRETQDYFLAELTPLRRAILEQRNPASVTWFCRLLSRLSQSAISPLHIGSNVYDVLEDGYQAHLLEVDALKALAVAIGGMRHDYDGKSLADELEPADERAAHLALCIVKVGNASQLGRIIGNAGFDRKNQMPRRLTMSNGFNEDIYQEVAVRLGYKSWPR